MSANDPLRRLERAFAFVILRRAQRDRGTQRRARARTCRADDDRQIAFGAAGSPGLRRQGGLPEDDERKENVALGFSAFDPLRTVRRS